MTVCIGVLDIDTFCEGPGKLADPLPVLLRFLLGPFQSAAEGKPDQKRTQGDRYHRDHDQKPGVFIKGHGFCDHDVRFFLDLSGQRVDQRIAVGIGSAVQVRINRGRYLFLRRRLRLVIETFQLCGNDRIVQGVGQCIRIDHHTFCIGRDRHFPVFHGIELIIYLYKRNRKLDLMIIGIGVVDIDACHTGASGNI